MELPQAPLLPHSPSKRPTNDTIRMLDISFHAIPATLLLLDTLLLTPLFSPPPSPPSHSPSSSDSFSQSLPPSTPAQPYPSLTSQLITSLSLTTAYYVWVQHCYRQNGYYPYPLFEAVGPLARGGVFLGAGMGMVLLGWGLGLLRWALWGEVSRQGRGGKLD